ncbi:MAG: hypothetical protein JKX68_12020 [Flavobacteriales bacterium]|nr:hypothetical protein [Flavobacteriales bacterium]
MAGNQDPPPFGVPPNCKNKSVAGSVAHNAIAPSIPESGRGLTTIDIASLSPQPKV